MEFDALVLHVLMSARSPCKDTAIHLHDRFANLFAENRFKGDLIDTNKSHTLWLLLVDCHGNFHTNEAGSDDDHLRLLGDCPIDELGVVKRSQRKDTVEVLAVDGDLAWLSARSEDEVVVFDGLGVGGGDGVAGGIDFGDALRGQTCVGALGGRISQWLVGSRHQSPP